MSKSGLVVTEKDGVCVVDFRDESVLDGKAVPAITEDLYDLVDDRGHAKILLDLSAVRFLSSPMIGTLVALHKKAVDRGGEAVLCGLSANLYRAFQVSRLDTVLRFAASAQAGERFFGKPGGRTPATGPIEPAPPSRWARIDTKQIRIMFSGAMVLVPLVITVWVVWSLGAWLDGLGTKLLPKDHMLPTGTGVLIIIGVIYVTGLLTHLWVFRGAFGLVERVFVRLPGVKTIYESVRDLLKLFGGDSQEMGRVVQYNVPGTDMSLLGILTNENPFGLAPDSPHRKVAVYVPYSYMFGGPTFFASPEHIVDVDMSVEQCMKTAATAMVGTQAILPQSRKKK